MGVELAGIVSAKYAYLPAGPFKILMRMAITALDKPNKGGHPARLYYGGWDDLALALGRDIPPPDDRARQRVLINEVVRHTTTLVREQAVDRAVDNPRAGYQQRWILTLGEAIRIVLPE